MLKIQIKNWASCSSIAKEKGSYLFGISLADVLRPQKRDIRLSQSICISSCAFCSMIACSDVLPMALEAALDARSPWDSAVIAEKHLLWARATSIQPGVFNTRLQSLCNPALKVTAEKSQQASRKPLKMICTAEKSCESCIKYSGGQKHAARACTTAHVFPAAF